MKPVNIVLLVLAGAIGGAVVMRVVQRPRPMAIATAPLPALAPTAAQVEAPATAPTTPPVDTAPSVALEQDKPSPIQEGPAPEKRAALRPTSRRVLPARTPEPLTVAQAAPEPPVAPPVEVAAPAPPQPAPPAPADSENTTPPAPPAPEPHKVTLNAGMLIPVRLVDGLSTERNARGDAFTATLYRELVVDGFVIAERGARVEGRVVASEPGGQVKGGAALAVELTRIHTSDGQDVAIQTDSFERHAEVNHNADAAKIGGGAVIGAVIGGIAGGGKGAAIGAGVGGGAGAGDVLLTRGKPATLPSETRITFRLRLPVTLTEQRGA